MKDIIINVDSTSHKVNFPDEFLGIGYENLQGNIIFQFDNNFIGGEARLEVSIDEESGIIPSLTHYENGYIVPIKSSLLTGTNVLMQLVIDETSLTKYTLTTDTQVNHNKTYYEKVGNDYLPVENPNAHDLPTYYEANTPVFKTDIFSLKVKDSINAQETIPEQYPTWINTFNILVATLNQKLLLVDQALTEMGNLNISVSNKVNGEVTITFTDKQGNQKEVKINDGRGIVSIIKTGTSGNVDTYTITYTDNTTSTFQVTNGIDGTDGIGIESIYLTGTSGLTDTYTILYTDGTTTEFQVKNGKGITKIEKISTNLLVDTYKFTFNDGTTQNYEITNGKGIVSIQKTSTEGLTDIYTITYNDNTTTTFNVVNGKGIVSIEKTSTSGYVDTYTITYNDGTTTTYEVTNGEVSQAQLDALQDELNYYKTIVNVLPKITGTGTYITLNNTADSILSNVLNPSELNQETTTGTNLIGLDTQQYKVNLQAGDKITLKNTTSTVLNLSLFTNYGDTTRNDFWSIGEKAQRTVTLTQNTKAIAWTTNVASDGYAWVNEGTTPLPYEPYTGGIPAPNPQFPMPVHSVSGSNTITIGNKNFMAIATQLNGYIDTTTLKFVNDNASAQNSVGYYFKTSNLPDEITISDVGGNRINVCYFNEVPANGVSTTLRSASNSNPRTITVDKTYSYVHIQFSYNDTNVSNIQVESGSTKTDYVAPTSQEANINLGNIEYCEIGDYKDEFVRDNEGNWGIRKNIGKVVLDGSETWGNVSGASNRWHIALPTHLAIYPININKTYLSTHFIAVNIGTNTGTWGNFYLSSGFLVLLDKDNNFANTTQLTAWLGTNKPTIYFAQTPTYTPITGTLAEELEAIYNSKSKDGQTNISQINNDLPFIIDSTALKDITNL